MRIAAIVAALSAVACAGVMPVAQSVTLRPGAYHFYETPSGVQTPLEGTLRFFEDSVAVVDVPCRQDRRQRITDSFSFNCLTYTITADHSMSTWVVRYSTSKRVQTVKEECVFTRGPDGKTVCSKKIQNREEHEVPVQGLLRLTPVESVAPPR